MAAAQARDAARAVAAAHDALMRARRPMDALVLLDGGLRRTRIFRAIAAGIEIDLGMGGTHGAENERRACEEFFHGVDVMMGERPLSHRRQNRLFR